MVENKYQTFNLFIPITNECNQHCDFCEVPLFKFKHLTLDDFQRTLDERIQAFHFPSNISINIGGGEPLLNEDLLPIIHYCHERKMNSKDIKGMILFTNGIRLGDSNFFKRFIDFLITKNIAMDFIISTTNFSPDTQRGLQYLFESDYNRCQIHIKVVVSKHFISNIDTWYNNIIPIIGGDHNKFFSLRFRFINFKYKAEMQGDKYLTKYSQIMPDLEKHISLFLEKGIIVQTEFFPWCVWNDKKLYFNHQFMPKIKYDLKEQNGVFIDVCNDCGQKEACNGFTRWTIPDKAELVMS
jgi:hypothetical protein